MSTISDLFIVEPFDTGWIIERLVRDIAVECRARGIRVSIGAENSYLGQQVALHSRFLYANPISSAKINAVFMTHIDDMGKEFEVKTLFGHMDSFLCMSPQEADILVQMGCLPAKVRGIELPHRGGFVNRVRVCVFSDRYGDKRKNETWILDYFRSREPHFRQKIIFTFLGHGWERFCEELGKLGVSYEIICYDHALPGEFELQRLMLEKMDHMLYMGFDGGAMCVYEGLKANLHLAVTDFSYHRGLPADTDYFNSQSDFFSFLDRIAVRILEREQIFNDRSIQVYVTKMLAHWEEIISGADGPVSVAPSSPDSLVEADYRERYATLTIRRFVSSLFRLVKRYLRPG